MLLQKQNASVLFHVPKCLAQPLNVVLVYNLSCDVTRFRKDIPSCASVSYLSTDNYNYANHYNNNLMMKMVVS